MVRLNTLLFSNTAACISVALLACAGAVALPHIALFMVLCLIAFAIETFGLKRPSRIAVNILSVCALLAIVRTLRYNNVIETFTGAVLVLIAVKMMEEKRGKDYAQILGLVVLAVLSAAIVSYVESVVYYSLLISILAGVEFVLISWFVKQPGALLTARQALRIVGGAVLIWVSMLPICLILFFIAPRTNAVMTQFQQPARAPVSSGFSDQVTLGSVREIQLSEEIAFRAEAPLLPPGSLYWRGMTLEAFNGFAWLPARRSYSRGPFTAEGQTVVQKILMEPGYHRVFFALDKPVQIEGRNAVSLGDGNFVNTDARTSGRLEYTAHSRISSSMKTFNLDRSRNIYLSLPENYMPELRAVTDGITYGRSDREKAEAVMAYLRPPDFEYTLNELPTSSNPLGEFIFSSRKGNCEYFASAMAVMLRQAGVPSRLVAGYQGGEYNSASGYYIVSQSDAHVWVEAWNSETEAWERHDPTPSAVAGSDQAEAKYNFLSFYIDALNYRVSKIFLEYDSESQWEMLGSLRRVLRNSGSLANVNGGKLFAFLGKLAALPAAAIAMFFIFTAAKKIIKRRKNREIALLHDFLRVMKRKGYEKNPCAGLEEFVDFIQNDRGNMPESAETAALARSFVLRFEEFYFRDISIDPDSETELRSILKRIRAV
ncbi:MAG: DUF3488 and transglutaminase-like domain-containing protein [Synergistaceae bacterium]|jgi:transglutaminase-like putative cysteine protease|nr:DUF3488 and transglutaminase-like domain-containing protein [Synergistaceae bacterium]